MGIAGRPGGPDWYFNLVRAFVHLTTTAHNSTPMSVLHPKRTGRFWAPRAHTHILTTIPTNPTPPHQNQVDNQRSHGPGGQGPEADPCFATVVRGQETIEEYHKVGP